LKVLFVCAGNICRSPMAAGYLAQRAAMDGLSHLVVESAGTLGIEAAPAAANAVRVAAEHGFDLTRHRSRGLRAHDVATSDLVIAMEQRQVDRIRAAFPGVHATVTVLRAFERGPVPSDDASDLADPVGEALPAFRSCFRTIRTCVDHLVLSLKHGS
jgi:protein-tyrosine phosphatase